MADNITVPGVGTVLATDDLAGIHWPYTKLASGADGSATPVSAAAPLPVAQQGAVDTTATTFARVVASGVVTRPANTTPYAGAGLIVGVAGGGASGRFQFANFALGNARNVRIERARAFKSQANAVGNFQLYLFRGDPAGAAVADAAAAASVLALGNAAAAVQLIGRFALNFANAAVGSDGAQVAGLPTIGAAVLANSGTGLADLFGVLVTAGAYTPITGEAFSIVLEGYAF